MSVIYLAFVVTFFLSVTKDSQFYPMARPAPNNPLAVWGADRQLLLSDHAEASSFRGTLSTTQDYFIMVKGRPDGNTSYIKTVTISPLSSS